MVPTLLDRSVPPHLSSSSTSNVVTGGWMDAVYAYAHCGGDETFPGSVHDLKAGGPHAAPIRGISSLWIPSGYTVILTRDDGRTITYGPYTTSKFAVCLVDVGYNDRIVSYQVYDGSVTTNSPTTAPVFQTTAPPTTTTAAPVFQTTAPPTTTTAAPVFQTTEPATTTAAPVFQTTAVPATTAVPVTTTAPATTAAPVTCMRPADGSSFMERDTGALFRYENGGLRAYGSHDVYKSWGSPPYLVKSTDYLTRCFSKGPPMSARVIQTTPPPNTTPAPHPSFDPTVYVMVHADSYLNNQGLNVLSLEFGQLNINEFVDEDLSQIWMINPDGHVRSVSGDGHYIAASDDCLAPTTLSRPSTATRWSIRPTGTHQYAYTMHAGCGTALARAGRGTTLTAKGDTWFVVPVGRAQME